VSEELEEAYPLSEMSANLANISATSLAGQADRMQGRERHAVQTISCALIVDH
jgi:hypothetical protein